MLNVTDYEHLRPKATIAFSLPLQSRGKKIILLAFNDLQHSLYLEDPVTHTSHSHAPSEHEKMFINTNQPKDKF